MNFRRANIEDIPELNKISYSSKQHWGYPDEWMEHWRNDLQLTGEVIESQLVVVLLVEEQLAGFCVVKEEEQQNEVMHLWVLPGCIGKGYGKQLLAHSLSSCTGPGKEVIVTSDPHAEGFYARQGFVTFSQEESYPPGRFLPVMKRVAGELA